VIFRRENELVGTPVSDQCPECFVAFGLRAKIDLQSSRRG